MHKELHMWEGSQLPNWPIHSRYSVSSFSEFFSKFSILLALAIFLLGATINIHSDYLLRNLRKPGETGHKIPRGEWFLQKTNEFKNLRRNVRICFRCEFLRGNCWMVRLFPVHPDTRRIRPVLFLRIESRSPCVSPPQGLSQEIPQLPQKSSSPHSLSNLIYERVVCLG